VLHKDTIGNCGVRQKRNDRWFMVIYSSYNNSWFYVKMMAYNATWFPPDGCILEPKEKWQSLPENWIGKEPERFYAFLGWMLRGCCKLMIFYHLFVTAFFFLNKKENF